ncbi:hypothetical protein [Tunturiibacter lichenicola]|uniref:hypothetical protein n=1 Tax=Tunturiibacter lichenicola TaxID=2051959 RepID=UPI0021B1DBB8|nr:hypothetical protein [Edaphobacter lichenicola]
MATVVMLALVTTLLGCALLHSYISANRLARCSWEELVGKLHPLESAGIVTVAMNHLVPAKDQLELQPEEMWNLLGGLEGLQQMRENGRILIALASYVERWNYEEGVIIAERMRRDGLQLRRAVTRIMLETFIGMKQVHIPFHLHEAASSYYLMRQRLLALYQTNHAGLYPRLVEAL